MAETAIKCPHCQQELSLDEQYLGMEVECPACGNPFIANTMADNAPQAKETVVKCSHCQAEMSMDEQYLGMEVECPACGNSFVTQKALSMPQLSLKKPESLQQNSAADEMKQKVKSNLETTAKALKNNALSAAGEAKQMASSLVANIKSKQKIEEEIEEDIIFDENDKSTILRSPQIIFSRKKVRDFFSTIKRHHTGTAFITYIVGFFSSLTVFIPIIMGIFSLSKERLKLNAVKHFLLLKKWDHVFLEDLDLLPRFGKKNEQLVAPVQTLYSPLFTDNEDSDVSYKTEMVDIGNEQYEYIYSTEIVTKIYTFEDQLFVYNLFWDYTVGQFVYENSDSFFFKDITNISTENEYEEIDNEKPSFTFDFAGLLRSILNFFKYHFKLIIVFFFLCCLGGIIYHCCHHSDKADVWRGIFANNHVLNLLELYSQAPEINEKELKFLVEYHNNTVIESDQKSPYEKYLEESEQKEEAKKRLDEIIKGYPLTAEVNRLYLEDEFKFIKEYWEASYYDQDDVRDRYKEKCVERHDSGMTAYVMKILLRCFLTELACAIGFCLLTLLVVPILIIIWKFIYALLKWLLMNYGSNFYRKSETLTITASSGNKISLTILCDEWLEANHGILSGKRSDNEKIFHAIRKMIEEKKVAADE